MEGKSYLGVVDYIVICISLLISVGIGLLSKFKGSKKMTATEYILAGRNMTRIPVILSVVVTFLSPSCILSAPAEVYKYGFQFAIGPLVMPIGMVLASWVFIPVYFQCGVSTVYEFLEMRFGSKTRYIISAFFVVQMIFFIVLNLYGAVLAFSAVTDLSIELSVISLGVICTLYCSVGGLKAVLWTDVYQAALILVCLTSLYIAGIGDAGGISKIYNQANSDNRLEMFK
nr:sodium-coupled monocarboxylate transporter 1-like [Parasteatoda tepidariorum]